MSSSVVGTAAAEVNAVTSARRSKRFVIVRVAAALGFFALAEAALFHSGFYASYIKPDSSAGQVMSMLTHERDREIRSRRQVLAVGDSRMSFRPKIAHQHAPSSGYRFATIMVPGTTPRVWYYMLREVDPTRDRYAAILIPIDDYDDDDWENMADRAADLHYLAPLLRLSDVVDFTSSFDSWTMRWEALRSVLLRGWTYHKDFQALLTDHAERIEAINWVNEQGARAIYDHVPSDNNLKGLTVDYATRTVHYPEGITDAGRVIIQANLLRAATPRRTGQRAIYRMRWFGKLAQYYRGSRTKLIILRAPRGPVVRPDLAVDEPSSSIRELARRGDVLLINEKVFDELERPELYVDGVHLNNPGSVRFTQLITDETIRLLGAASPAPRPLNH